ncbi:MAG: bifunctional proline dehydrogenase/L-glutamate gamma-semialdehyde dehydrogenase PutA, partial [Rhodanobacteraceae bacterium]
MSDAWSSAEADVVETLLQRATLPAEEQRQIMDKAADLVRRVRKRADDQTAIEFFMRQYDLSSEEGVLLMCVAEALLRIPDTATIDRLIRDKLGDADWDEHLGGSESVLVNASTWGLMLTGRMIHLCEDTRKNYAGTLSRLVSRSGEPAIRLAVRQAMRIMGHQFVMGRNINEALKRAERKAHRQYRYSFDMLGEAALTEADAQRFFDAYANAITILGKRGPWDDLHQAPSISVKLSAIHPRYEAMNRRRAREELAPRLLKLAQLAAEKHISITVDAEEADRLSASLDVIEFIATHPSLEGWHGFGMAVQAYQKRAPAVIAWLADLAQRTQRRLSVRLVKGAYWDYEIKHAQELGLVGYPVFTRKPNTDVSYLACVRQLLDTDPQWIYPAFATHNAHTIAAVQHLAGERTFEFQRLHGMGSDLYGEVMGEGKLNVPCRVYAPVGSHKELLPYLVRRLLENGANTSFVNQILDEEQPVDELVADPCRLAREAEPKQHPRIPLPENLFGSTRKNSMGINLANDNELAELAEAANRYQ